ncbi:hypothetical protein [Mesorhizobium sp. WSM4906]|uniref:hypothetical protein n=1 Tax=Mesorhizobium sp. WSM4906 TaxID=3038546 RepID=UPI0024177671|nr:hypothetical protein [Mesorhizobium sp. WSM4906]WFP74538.1 hypothetical protein QAZ22_22705 [Mesorhizobium sp. WSM4906]
MIPEQKSHSSKAPVIPTFKPDGSAFDLIDPQPSDISFGDMANTLSKLARFNGLYRCPAYSVAQHSVMGADALYRESGDGVAAGYFLLHDGHEYALGDITRPAVDLIQHHIARLAEEAGVEGAGFVDRLAHRALASVKRSIDVAVYQAAGLPNINTVSQYARQIREMDDRMLVAEATALFGASSRSTCLPRVSLPPPKLVGAIVPWGAMKAELAFIDRLQRYVGIAARAR